MTRDFKLRHYPDVVVGQLAEGNRMKGQKAD